MTHTADVRTAGGRLEFLLACIAVFLVPMNVLRLPGLYFTASDFFVCLCLLTLLLNRRVCLTPLGPGSGFWIFGLALMVGTLLMSSILVGAIGRALILMSQYLFTFLLLPIVFLNRSKAETRTLMLVFIAAITVLVLHGILVVDILKEHNTDFVSGNGRLRGLVERENECGALIALTVPMLLALTFSGALKPVVTIVLLPLFAYGIMLTGSNTALYALLFGISLAFIASMSLKRTIIAAASVCLVFAIAQVPEVSTRLPATFQKRVLVGLETGNLDDAGTFSERMLLNKEAVQLAGNAIVAGYGADQYRVVSKYRQSVHNFYLLILDEGGLGALAGFLILLAGAVITVVTAARYPGGGPMIVCASTTLVLFCVLIAAVPHIYGRFWATPLLLALAPAVAQINARRISTRGRAPRTTQPARMIATLS